jgi:poly(3-hydroxybutyrate) depolymerase
MTQAHRTFSIECARYAEARVKRRTRFAVLVAFASLLPLRAAHAQDELKPEDVLVGGDAHQRYLLHGPAADAKPPRDGWRLLVVMPGGNGSAEFAPFVGRIRENALDGDWLIAQVVAPKWSEDQTIVWPTQRNPTPGMEFGCEELFAAVVKDVAAKRELDPRYLFTLSWSSSGMLAYGLALDPERGVTGSFVAMSVYKPDELPSLKKAKGERFYILHSPDDKVCPPRMAEQARDELDEAGAIVEYATYAGGHGWQGDVYGNLRTGLAWLEKQAEKAKLRKRPK